MEIEPSPLNRLSKAKSNNASSMRTSTKIPNYFRLRVMALILYSTALIIFIYASFASAGELILRDRPLTESEKLTTIDLSSEEKIMGQEQPPVKLLESQITIGKEFVFFIPPQKSRSAAVITEYVNEFETLPVRI